MVHNPFKSKPKPKYTAPAGPVTLTRDQFKNMLRSQSTQFRLYRGKIGPAADRAMDDMFTESMRAMTPQGFWQFGSSAGPGGATALRFQNDAGLKDFSDAMEDLLKFEMSKIDNRANHIRSLKAQAQGGTLYAQLRNNTEPERNYYQAPVGAGGGWQRADAQTMAAAWLAKATAWANLGAGAAEVANRARYDGSNPLGANDQMLRTVWTAVAAGAPAYRGWNATAYQQKYPSNIGGTWVLNQMLTDLNGTTMPNRGDNGWYDLALYALGAIMAAQAFTDANKRMARFAYCLMILSGGVPLVAPNARLGSQLADMM